jgi:hypothetical protein
MSVHLEIAMTAARVKEIRKSVAKSPKEFEAQFWVPARTVEGWEQGRRRLPISAAILLTLIAKNPDLIRQALKDSLQFTCGTRRVSEDRAKELLDGCDEDTPHP